MLYVVVCTIENCLSKEVFLSKQNIYYMALECYFVTRCQDTFSTIAIFIIIECSTLLQLHHIYYKGVILLLLLFSICFNT